MVSSTAQQNEGGDRQWYIVSRWLAYEGESRANVLRLVGIAAFYVIELINYHGLNLGFIELPQVVDAAFHRTVTALALGWAVASLIVLYCTSHRFFPDWLKFISTGLDLVFLTFVLVVASGPSSPLVVGYFLLIGLSSLRFSLPLIWFATIGSMAGYLILLGYAKWYAVELRVPRYHQLIVLLAMALLGIIIGQVIRRVRGIATDFALRQQAVEGGD